MMGAPRLNEGLVVGVRQISRHRLLFETYSRYGSIFKLFPAWCRYLCKKYATRRSHWRVWHRGDSWHWSRQCYWRFKVGGTPQFDWRFA